MPKHNSMDALLASPCAICGYNGSRYWQRETHTRDCPWYFIGGKTARERAVRALAPRMKANR